MSCYLIKVENGHKVARSITSEEEYKQLRGSNEQKANLRLARAGNDAAKRRLVQFNYSGHYPQGVVKGMKLPSGAFGFDMDEPEAFAKAAKLLLKEPDKYGLLMLERSARQGGHAVFEREKGKTILENQVRIATMLKCEMDTSAHDINRVYFTTTSDDEDLLFLSPRLFKDEYDETAVAAEGKVLEERERYGQEELPEGAHKANKHYEPWKEEFKKDSQGVFKSQEFKNSRISSSAAPSSSSAPSSSAASSSAASSASTTSAAQDNYLGIPYGEIIKKWWQMYNDGQEPMRSNRNTLTFELAVNLRHICGFDRNLLAQIIPCYDGFPEQEKMACINSALNEKITQMPKRLKDVLSAIRQERMKQGNAGGGSTADNEALVNALDEANAKDDLFYYNALPKLPQGIRDSVSAVGPALALPVITAICPAIGMLATGVKVSVHGKMNSLNLISYIAGDFASGKGSIDPVIDAWTSEVKEMDKMYQQKKHAKEMKQKQVKVETKEIRFGPQTDEHDYQFKLKHAKEFLNEGNKVRAYVFFRGRSILFKEQGEVLLLRFANDLEECGKVEQMPKLEGKKMFLYMSPKKAGTAKKSQQKMDREKREAEAKAAADAERAANAEKNGLLANAKGGDALKKLAEGTED